MGREITITLDEDVAARLDAEVARVQRPINEVINDILRRAWNIQRRVPDVPPVSA